MTESVILKKNNKKGYEKNFFFHSPVVVILPFLTLYLENGDISLNVEITFGKFSST